MKDKLDLYKPQKTQGSAFKRSLRQRSITDVISLDFILAHEQGRIIKNRKRTLRAWMSPAFELWDPHMRPLKHTPKDFKRLKETLQLDIARSAQTGGKKW